MRVLVVCAHPVETRFVAAPRRLVIDAPRLSSHAVDDRDLNAEGFDPATSRRGRVDYHVAAVNSAPVAPRAAIPSQSSQSAIAPHTTSS